MRFPLRRLPKTTTLIPKFSTRNGKTANHYAARRYPGVVSEVFPACIRESGGSGGIIRCPHGRQGPSLGTNFTPACPYTIFAHYAELDWAALYDVPRSLVRIGFRCGERLLAA